MHSTDHNKIYNIVFTVSVILPVLHDVDRFVDEPGFPRWKGASRILQHHVWRSAASGY